MKKSINANIEDGSILLYRSILNSQVFAHQIALKIWIWCLCKATFKERFIPLKIGRGDITIKINPGQFIFGRFKAEEELGIDGSTIYKWMQKFASDAFDNMIEIESNNQYSIITICNWDIYQNLKTKRVTTKEQPKNNQVTTEEQPSNTNNNVNNVNNTSTWRDDFSVYLNECKEGYRLYMENPDLIKTQQRLNPGINIRLSIEKGFTNFWGTEAGWEHKRKKKIDKINWERTITNSISMNSVRYTKEELAAQQ